MKKGLILVGMPGAGKSFWARKLGEHWGWVSLDLDDFLVEREGRTIEQIMEADGEAGFREKESLALEALLAGVESSPFVLATGGGTFCREINRRILKSAGWTVYLRTSPEVLVNRLSAEGASVRPLLTAGASLTSRVQRLLDQRSRDYEKADHILEADPASLGKFEAILRLCIKSS